MRQIRFLLVLVATTLAVAALTVPSAGAHSTLIRGCPGPGDVLNEVDRLVLDFRSPLIDDEIAKVDILRSSDEFEPRVGPPVFSEDLLTVAVDVIDDLEPGAYVLRYRVTSADGDENDGGFEFTIDPDADPDSETCEIIEENSGAGGFILLGVGVVAIGALFWFLRPRKTAESARS
ncbi:MAG: copper resistance protein CopC [Actinomycetota bacterium]